MKTFVRQIVLAFGGFCVLSPQLVRADTLDIKVNSASLIVVASAQRLRVLAPTPSGYGHSSIMREEDTETLTERSDLTAVADLVVTDVLYSANRVVPSTLKVSLKGAYSLVSRLRRDLVGRELIYYLLASADNDNFGGSGSGSGSKDELRFILPGHHWAFEPDDVGKREIITATIQEWHTGTKRIPPAYLSAHQTWLSLGTDLASDEICAISRTADKQETFAYIKALQVLNSADFWKPAKERVGLFHRSPTSASASPMATQRRAYAAANPILKCLKDIGTGGPPAIQYALASFDILADDAGRLLKSAADSGYGPAQFVAAKHVFAPRAVFGGYASTERLLLMERAADGGDVRAQYEAACAYSTVDCGEDHGLMRALAYRTALKLNPERAAKWLLSAITGLPALPDFPFDPDPFMGSQAVSERQVIYLEGRTISLRNNIRTMLAQMYERGYGVPQDYGKAFGLYKEAAENGDPYGASQVAHYYDEGLVVERDTAKSHYWRQIADRLGLRVKVPLI